MADKKKEEKKAADKVLDADDEAFCGFCSIQLLDQDGMSGKTLGMSVKAPLHITSAPGADSVTMEALFHAGNPLFFLEVRNEEQYYIFGQWWMDGPKHSENSMFLQTIPLKATEAHKQMEKNSNQDFGGEGQCDFLKNSTSRLMKINFSTEEKKFKTKLTKAVVTVPREAWMEFKQYRLKLWKSGKNWAGSEKDDKDEEKKDEEKKD